MPRTKTKAKKLPKNVLGNQKKGSQDEESILKNEPLYQALLKLKHLGPRLILRIAKYYRSDAESKTLIGGLYLFDTKMRANPYLTSEVQYWTIDDIDDLVVHLPATHPYHMGYADQRRVPFIVKAFFLNQEYEGRSVLSDEQYRQVLIQAYCFLMENTPKPLLTNGLKDEFVRQLKNAQTYRQVNYRAFGKRLTGKMDRDYYDRIHQLAMKMINLAHNPAAHSDVDEVQLQHVFDHLTTFDSNHQQVKLNLHDDQKQIVHELIKDPISVLTGYAGTGKTTLVRALVKYLATLGIPMSLCATSGKASFNLKVTTGADANTIASLILSDPLKSPAVRNLVRAKYLIIDEISMVSERDLAALFTMIPADCHVIMIGDRAQLPAVKSVGVMISLPMFLQNSKTIAWHNLTQTIRQDKQSRAGIDATKIRNQITPNNLTKTDDSIDYVKVGGVLDVVNHYIDVAKATGRDNLLVITPMNKDADFVNERLQQYYQKQNRLTVDDRVAFSVDGAYRQFYVGDHILINHNMKKRAVVGSDQTVNIYNGFVGQVTNIIERQIKHRVVQYFDAQGREVTSITTQGTHSLHMRSHDEVTVYRGARIEFADVLDDLNRPISIDFFPDAFVGEINGDEESRGLDATPYGDLDSVQLGYALTVHKSQGSTINRVIAYIDSRSDPKFISRQLLYTALTRGKKMDVLIYGDLTDSVLAPFVNSNVYVTMTSNLAYELAIYDRTYQALYRN